MGNKVIVSTIVNDIHGLAVLYSLKQDGVDCFRWLGSSFPTGQLITFDPEAEISSSIIESNNNRAMKCDFSTGESSFWLRRIAYPTFPTEGNILNVNDRLFAESESKNFIEGWLHTISEGFCINPFVAKSRANSKALQLKLATQIGFNIPETIISNNPDALKLRLRESSDSKWIYKPFRVHQWDAKDSSFITHAAIISEDILPEDEIISWVPGIYQRLIANKKCEIRATFFGTHCVAASITKLPTDRIDWRGKNPEELGIISINLPKYVEDQCRALMSKLGLRFGCFDLVLDEAGKYWFLEVNESGQFLWIERANPEIPLLDICCDFLLKKDFNYTYKKRVPSHSYVDLISTGVIDELLTMEENLVLPISKYSYEETTT